MSQSTWDRVREIFHEAVDLPPEERSDFLARVCEGRPDVRNDVLGLLEHHDAAGDFLTVPVVELAASLADEADLDVGTALGPWRIVRELGRGGMGAVYLARRDDDQFEQEVAVKVVKRGMDTDEILRRFRAERQILARLTHPNIGRLLDGGVTPDGRPYVVMEYVDGIPITRFCRERGLGIDARLSLFLDACAAVDDAHRALVLHRDLKPSNILVRPDGTLKLLDFGIAKVLAGDPDATQRWTLDEPRFLTVSHASPEQLRGEPLSTASDVYALGVVLYELLTGRRPLQTTGRPRTAAIEAVLREDPARPSAVAEPDDHDASGDPAPAGGARERERVRRRLRGDLDTIVLKVLRKEPERRYGTASELAEDIRRHLEGRPVRAREDARWYRVGKFLGRHRLGSTAAVVALVALVGGAAVFVSQSLRIARERDKAREVTQLLISMFEGADPLGPGADTLTARSLLERGAARIGSELERQPETEAELQAAIGQAFLHLGLFEDAEERLARSVALRRETGGSGDPELATALNHLAVVLDQRGRYDEAERHFEEALTIQRDRLTPPDLELAATMNNFGRFLLVVRTDAPRAEPLLRGSLEMRRAHLDPPDIQLAESLHNLALLHQIEGRYGPAVDLYVESLDMRRDLLGPDHPQVMPTVNNLALVLHALGRYDEAEPLMRESLATRVRSLGDEHPTVAIAKGNLAMLLRDRGEYRAAEPLFREALEVTRGAWGPTHPRSATVENNLAETLRLDGRLSEAEPLFLASLESRIASLGADHPHVFFSLSGLGELRRAQGDHVGADTLLGAALERRLALLGEEHGDVATSLHQLGTLRADMGALAEAETLLRRALDLRVRVLDPSHPAVAESALALAEVLLAGGRPDEAAPLLADALTIRERAFGPDHPRTAEVRERVAATSGG